MALGTRYPPHMFFAFAIAAFIFVSFLLYNSVDSSDRRRIASYNHLDAPDVARLKEKLGDLEKEVQLNDKYVNDLDEKLNRLANDQSERLQKVDPGAPQGQGGVLAPPPASPAAPPQNVHLKEEELAGGGNKVQVVHQVLKAKSTPSSSAATRNFVAQVAPVSGSLVCPATSIPHEAEGDVQMLNAYEAIPFDNPDGGVWKQGWELTYDKEKIKQEKKLEVVVIPHSHCDP
ncbi:Protein AMAN-2, partial [Aphelenchoides avenae]